jgi:hypothetical protein
LDLEYFSFRLLDLITHQEVPKLFSQQELRGLVDKTTAQQPKLQQFETDRQRRPGVRKFSVKIFLNLIICHEVPKLKLFSQQDLVDKMTAQQPKVQQFESTVFQDSQAAAAAETSGN